MHGRDIIVVGTSAGGLEALRVFVNGLPKDLKAAVFVVLHIGVGIDGESQLPQILTKAGPLRAGGAVDGEKIRWGRIYIAPPDHHMTLEDGRVRVIRGPKENRTRPAINPLFRSAANVYGKRVTGVILTGLMDDGVAGLAEIQRRGGATVVQDPDTALYDEMPRNAIDGVKVEYVIRLDEIAGLVSKLAMTTEPVVPEKEEQMKRTLSKFTCPECRGPLWEERQGKIVEYKCRVGHVFSTRAMATEYHETIERTLWSSIVVLEEGAEMIEKLSRKHGDEFMKAGETWRAQAKALQGMLSEGSGTGRRR